MKFEFANKGKRAVIVRTLTQKIGKLKNEVIPPVLAIPEPK